MVLIPIITLIIYLPSVFRGEIVRCVLNTDGSIIYHKRDNAEFLQTLFYSVSDKQFFFHFSALIYIANSFQVYKVIVEIVFKLAPTVLIASLNVRIMIAYRQTCDKRRRMTLCHTKDDDSRKFAEERRLMLLLGEVENTNYQKYFFGTFSAPICRLRTRNV